MVFLLLLLLALPGVSFASTIVVPDDTPSIQAALDLMPDTVLVRSGVYAESPTLLMSYTSPGHIVVKGLGPTPPELDGFRILIHYQQEEIIVEGFHFKGLVRLDTGDEVTEWFRFRRCEFDASFAETWSDVYDVQGLEFSDCTIHGGLSCWAYHFHIFTNNVVDGPVRLSGRNMADGYGQDIRNNTIRAGVSQGSWPPGLWVDGDMVSGAIQGNRITGFPWGLYSPYATNLEVSGNRVEDAAYYGITVAGDAATVEDNETLRCGTGLKLDTALSVARGNVIGRSLHSGIEAYVDYGGLELIGNTIYLSGESAIQIKGYYGGPVHIARNLAYGSGSWGLNSAPPGTTLSCNDWFGNAAGAVFPSGPGATDLDVDPLFCSLPEDSVHLEAASPLIDAPGCGLIGARGEGCNRTTAVAAMAPEGERFRLGPIAPQPAVRDVEIRFELPRAAAVELVILDLQGRLIARLADGVHAAGEHRVRWPLGVERGPAAPGMYFARYRYPGGERTRALIRLR